VADRRIRAALLMLMLGLVAVAIWLFLPAKDPGETERTAAPMPAASEVDDPVASGAGQARPAQAAPAASAPLPLPGTPIAEVIAALKPRADTGDSRAACRLAVEMLRCQHLEQANQYVPSAGPSVEEILTRRGNFDGADQFAELEIRKIRLGQQCAAVDRALLAQASGYLADAAFAGEPEAMLRYAIGDQFGISGGNAFARDPDFERWRRESPGMLLRAVQAGHLQAVNMLGLAYRSDGSPFAGLVADDPVQGLAWGLVYSRLSGASRPAFESSDPDVQARASALASQWHARYFNNAVLAGDFSALHLQPLHSPMRPLEQERLCEPARAANGAAGL
jgi:hypothetical protein